MEITEQFTPFFYKSWTSVPSFIFFTTSFYTVTILGYLITWFINGNQTMPYISETIDLMNSSFGYYLIGVIGTLFSLCYNIIYLVMIGYFHQFVPCEKTKNKWLMRSYVIVSCIANITMALLFNFCMSCDKLLHSIFTGLTSISMVYLATVLFYFIYYTDKKYLNKVIILHKKWNIFMIFLGLIYISMTCFGILAVTKKKFIAAIFEWIFITLINLYTILLAFIVDPDLSFKIELRY